MKHFLVVVLVLLIGCDLVAQQKEKTDSVSVDSNLQQLEADTSGLPIVLTSEEGFSQADSVKYSASYQFRDGFYIGRMSFLKNQPITIDKVLTTVPYSDPQIYDKILSLGEFKSINADSSYTRYVLADVFGFVQNRVFYINLGQLGFVRMTNFGRICRLSYGESQPRIQPTAGVGVNSWGGAGVGVGIQINGGAATVTEYIFRIEGGPIVEFSPDMLLEMMKDDEIIFNSYLALNKRYRMKEMYTFINEYNRRNPLYLPIYK